MIYLLGNFILERRPTSCLMVLQKCNGPQMDFFLPGTGETFYKYLLEREFLVSKCFFEQFYDKRSSFPSSSSSSHPSVTFAPNTCRPFCEQSYQNRIGLHKNQHHSVRICCTIYKYTQFVSKRSQQATEPSPKVSLSSDSLFKLWRMIVDSSVSPSPKLLNLYIKNITVQIYIKRQVIDTQNDGVIKAGHENAVKV